MHKYFFALQPPPQAARDIAYATDALMRTRLGLGRRTRPCRLHISLKGIGTGTEPLDQVTQRARVVMAAVRRPPFRVAFNRTAAFGRGAERVLVLRGDEGLLGVDLLRAEIHAALASVGLAAPRAGPFEAHMTLARGWDDASETFIAPIAWTVREFVLIHSYVGETRYEVAGRFPLT